MRTHSYVFIGQHDSTVRDSGAHMVALCQLFEDGLESAVVRTVMVSSFL